MKRIIVLFILMILLSSCSKSVKFDKNNTAYMTASWYGKDYHGKKTASGEIFDMYALTAAHKTLAFGTELQITNEKNNKSTKVTINDRGPFVGGRDLDLSYEAAKEVGMIGCGIARLKVVYLGINHYYDKYIKR
ncbi:MAG: septal ring lytic transglycosylase RlpA family protein [Nitrospirae bacterium]|nr:septal ring lytic transglycosylase RlpA family protein [Nitrospirota bacterium]MBF0542151.1 septal ring lytic transglycosylase RlpA family protein [Nitrospirota bacterium]